MDRKTSHIGPLPISVDRCNVTNIEVAGLCEPIRYDTSTGILYIPQSFADRTAVAGNSQSSMLAEDSVN